ncbi:aspartyl-phosphate phosphatase Spo0E family protein [Tepidibacter thalassicus]|uniref:Spo0E like sporulation regulatory protein n=1 Tax=Tepidibacter thalassicus DSM 15285 TaxID=1123350 RepID=A0A1M5TRP4_9FIRM|nr:aspartyl-phosphate phosphatase Spo0E family protein [Tepidibacter thalassicus]SHH53437.1 Spo0E like sporulation regulatory protein [Tepidibacter thalassicus DSM 15285]
MDIHILKKQIEDTRTKLNILIKDENAIKNNDEILKLSQKLDILINIYISIKKH